jgi:hypothetical protein
LLPIFQAEILFANYTTHPNLIELSFLTNCFLIDKVANMPPTLSMELSGRALKKSQATKWHEEAAGDLFSTLP